MGKRKAEAAQVAAPAAVEEPEPEPCVPIEVVEPEPPECGTLIPLRVGVAAAMPEFLALAAGPESFADYEVAMPLFSPQPPGCRLPDASGPVSIPAPAPAPKNAPLPALPHVGLHWPVLWEDRIVSALRLADQHNLLEMAEGTRAADTTVAWAPIGLQQVEIVREEPEQPAEPVPALAGPIQILVQVARDSFAGERPCVLPLGSFVEGVFIPRFEALPLRPRLCLGPKPVEEAPTEEVRSEETKPEPSGFVLEDSPAETPAIDGPSFALAGVREGFWARMPLVAKIALVVAAVAAIGIPAWKMMSGTSTAPATAVAPAPVARPVALGPGGWFTKEATDTVGKARRRTISLLRPSLELSDYRMEFKGRIESKSLGWVVRLQDTDNYYAMKLRRVQGKLKLARATVIRGEETPQGEVDVPPVSAAGDGYEIRVDVRGPRITTFLQGRQIDSWTDSQLRTGGFGFSNEADERARIESIKFYLFSK